jgi:hypothetical protein
MRWIGQAMVVGESRSLFERPGREIGRGISLLERNGWGALLAYAPPGHDLISAAR